MLPTRGSYSSVTHFDGADPSKELSHQWELREVDKIWATREGRISSRCSGHYTASIPTRSSECSQCQEHMSDFRRQLCDHP